MDTDICVVTCRFNSRAHNARANSGIILRYNSSSASKSQQPVKSPLSSRSPKASYGVQTVWECVVRGARCEVRTGKGNGSRGGTKGKWGKGSRATVIRHGQKGAEQGESLGVRGVWCVVRGAKCEVRGAGCVVRGAWCEVRSAKCVVRGAWCEVRGAWCVTSASESKQPAKPALSSYNPNKLMRPREREAPASALEIL